MSDIIQHARRGFTVLEILIVLAVIGMLVALGVSQADKILGNSQESIARIYVSETIKIPLMSFKSHMLRYPSTQEGLGALVTQPSSNADRWRGPYVESKMVPLDPWGNPYQYRFPGTKNPEKYDVFSFGPSGREGNDDIGNW